MVYAENVLRKEKPMLNNGERLKNVVPPLQENGIIPFFLWRVVE